MVGTDHRPLEQRPCRLDGVGMNVTPNPFLRPVIDRCVGGVRVAHLLVGLQLVGVNRGGFVGNDRIQERRDLTLTATAGPAKSKLSAALDRAENGGPVGAPVESFNAASPAPFAILLGGFELAADESLVSL